VVWVDCFPVADGALLDHESATSHAIRYRHARRQHGSNPSAAGSTPHLADVVERRARLDRFRF